MTTENGGTSGGGTHEAIAISSAREFIYGKAPNPVRCGRGLEIGAGTVIPEINFTLPPIDINEETWAEIRGQYAEMIGEVSERAAELNAPGLLVEFETLPPMTVKPEWGAEITRILAETLQRAHERHGLKSALRLTPNDTREHERPPRMRSGPYWDGMVQLFNMAAEAGADMIAIESTGGKEICDQALMNADLRALVFALGILAPRDMEFLWTEIAKACEAGGIVPAGDTACGFANTAMVLAERKMLPRVFAAVTRVASVPRGLVAYECGAKGPSKDCAYEGPYMKAIAGVPISMEGHSAACAHLSSVGNVAQAVCDCWSNESVQNVRLLSANAPVVSVEQLIYDCRLMSVAASRSDEDALRLRDWLVESDAASDPQAWVLRPDVVLKLSSEIVQETTPYLRVRRAVRTAASEIQRAVKEGELRIPANEVKWLDRLIRQSEALPDSESAFIEEMMAKLKDAPYLPEEYGLAG
jgi:methanol--5-hydroxybenzimidazolylcobamide Co-methyltransferase